MARVILIVCDSFGVGGAADASLYRDQGSNTFGHIAERCAAGACDSDLRSGPLFLPNLRRLGLGNLAVQSTGEPVPGVPPHDQPTARYGYGVEQSKGKDTPSGHWEIAGFPVMFDWGYFPRAEPTFPPDLIAQLVERADLPGVLGLCHASGTEIIKEHGDEHIRTGKPIVYTSADSVLQIAAHEEHFGLERLYETCKTAFALTEPLMIGRVIARPFFGETPETFERTGNRRDFAIPPPEPTVLNHIADAGQDVISVGKIADIFANEGITQSHKVSGNMNIFDATITVMNDAVDGSLIFANLVDFDSLYGHRRDPRGYAEALEAFDRRIPELEAELKDGDLSIITADHGCDPVWTGTDHTREHVPILAFGPGIRPGSIGRRETFADIGATIARHLNVPATSQGVSWL
ncbi:MAG: phosphopentomutase [Pseudomonadota bacterium]